MQLDREFHVTIAGVLGNGFLVRVVGELFDQRINPYFTKLASYFETSESLGAGAGRASRDPRRIEAHEAKAQALPCAGISAVAGPIFAELRARPPAPRDRARGG